MVRVWVGARAATNAETFDQLRVGTDVDGSAGNCSLPPTSGIIRGHLQRGFFLVTKTRILLVTAEEHETIMKTVDHGWEEYFSTLLPSKCMKPLPLTLLTTCDSSGRCITRLCGCRSARVQCVVFCHGQREMDPHAKTGHLMNRSQTLMICCIFKGLV